MLEAAGSQDGDCEAQHACPNPLLKSTEVRAEDSDKSPCFDFVCTSSLLRHANLLITGASPKEQHHPQSKPQSEPPSTSIAIDSEAAKTSTAPMWPSTVFVQLFNLLYAAFAQVFHLLFAALSIIWTVLCIMFVVTMAALPLFGTGVAARETIALLYNLPRPKDEDEEMKNWFTWAAPCNVLFGIALAGLAWNNPETSWKRLLLEADCVVLEAGFIVVAIAAVVKGIAVLVKASKEKGFAVAMSEMHKELSQKVRDLELLSRLAKFNEFIAESDRLAREGSRKKDGSGHC